MSINRDLADSASVPPFRKNLIINGGMTISQRGAAFTSVGNAAYTLDRWQYATVGTGVVNISQQTNATPPAMTSSYMFLEVATADTSVAAGDVSLVQQQVEGYNIIPLGWHLDTQSKKKDITISFWHSFTKTGTHCVTIRNESNTRSYVSEFTQAVTNTWEYTTITVPAPTDGTWDVDNTTGLKLAFTAMAGTNYHTTADTWQSGNYFATSNQVNNLDNTINKMRITGVQIETGITPTDFEFRTIGEELALCYRYYQKSYQYGTAPGTVTSSGCQSYTAQRTAASQYISPAQFPVIMRAAPTMLVYGTDGVSNRINGIDSANLTLSDLARSERQIRVITTTTAHVLHDRYQFHWIANSEL